jgi:hypothetical protein
VIAKVAPRYIGGSFSGITMRAKISLAFADFTAHIMKDDVYYFCLVKDVKLTIKEQIEQYLKERTIKQHIKDNQIAIVGLGIVIVSVFSAVKRGPQIHNAPVFNNIIAPVFNNNNSSMVNFGGPMYKIVKDIDTGQIWEKMKYLADEIAKEHDIKPESAMAMVSKQVNGHSDHLYGHRYAIVGMGNGR